MDIPQAIINALQPFHFVKKVILFGSRARGDHQPKSDYDIAIDCPHASSEDRNLTSHIYSETEANQVFDRIHHQYLAELKRLFEFLKNRAVQ